MNDDESCNQPSHNWMTFRSFIPLNIQQIKNSILLCKEMSNNMSPQEEKTEEEEGVQFKDDAAVEDVELADTEDGSGEKENETDDKRIRMTVAADAPWTERMWEVFTTFWPLGFIAFGGPQAHVAILRDHLVIQRDWLDEEQFTELFAIGQVRGL